MINLDRTLADHSQRVKNTGNPEADHAYFMDPFRISKDSLNLWAHHFLLAMYEFGYEILITTDRPSNLRPATENWLKRNQIPYRTLFMRCISDDRTEYEVKHEMYQERIKPNYNVLFALDFSQSSCRAWRAHKLKVIKEFLGSSLPINQKY